MPKKRLPRKDQPKVSRKICQNGTKDANNVEEPSSAAQEDEKLQKELNWCIDQLRLGLMTQKATQKQTDETVKLIRTLASSTAPLVRKRQIMRQTFGDYRKKIADEEAKWRKDAERLQKVSSISCSKAGKSVFLRNSKDSHGQSLSEMFSKCTIGDGSGDDTDGKFRFNFNVSL